ncbi:hypothetical protein FHS15_001271 [Paenibacillus castaneae]|nr:hypothetical protein [Paenibacillus castaneae]
MRTNEKKPITSQRKGPITSIQIIVLAYFEL